MFPPDLLCPPATSHALAAAWKDAEVRIYHDAGHAFLNPDHGMGHEESARDAWPRAVAFLKSHTAQT